MDELKQDIYEILYDSNKKSIPSRFQTKWLQSYHPILLQKILDFTKNWQDNVSMSERVFCILNDIKNPPICNCGNYLKFRSNEKRYLIFCSTKCSNTFKAQKHGTPFQHKSIQQKIKRTNLERYGVENPFQNEQVKQKIKKTNLEKYGVEHIMHSEHIKKRVFDSQLTKYGNIYVKTDEFKQQRHHYQNSIFSNETKEKLENSDFLQTEHYVNNKTISQIARELGISFTSVWERFQKFNINARYDLSGTDWENEIQQFLETNQIKYIKNDRKIISPKEIDFYLPDNNLALELNGVYYHSTKFRSNKFYHYNKFQECNLKNIQLLQFYDLEWKEKPEIIKSIILNKCSHASTAYMARKLKLSKVGLIDEKDFMKTNHIQGHQNSTIAYGLYDDNNLICCMSFLKNRNGSNYDWELLRFSTRLNSQVIGGASKILKHFLKENICHILVSYADLRYSNGGLYDKLGFQLKHRTKPSYFYLQNGRIFHRRSFQKKLLSKKISNFDETLTEEQNLINNGIFRVYNAGQLVYVYSK